MKERITTTQAKAKEIAPLAENMITRAKKGGIASRRLLSRRLPGRAAEKLVKVIAPRFAERTGGYTRIIKLGKRGSDASKQAIIELVK